MAEAAVVCMTEGADKHANKFYDITGACARGREGGGHGAGPSAGS